jgi:hypothetical protein
VKGTLVFVVFVSAGLVAQGGTYQVDQSASSVFIHVGKGGLFSFAAHDHEVAAPALGGTVVLDQTDAAKSSVSLDFDAAALKVTGKGEPAKDVPEVQAAMLSEDHVSIDPRLCREQDYRPFYTQRSRRPYPPRHHQTCDDESRSRPQGHNVDRHRDRQDSPD